LAVAVATTGGGALGALVATAVGCGSGGVAIVGCGAGVGDGVAPSSDVVFAGGFVVSTATVPSGEIGAGSFAHATSDAAESARASPTAGARPALAQKGHSLAERT
jgi:hypothetical protein